MPIFKASFRLERATFVLVGGSLALKMGKASTTKLLKLLASHDITIGEHGTFDGYFTLSYPFSRGMRPSLDAVCVADAIKGTALED